MPAHHRWWAASTVIFVLSVIASIWMTGDARVVARSVLAIALLVVLAAAFVLWFRASQRNPAPLTDPEARPSAETRRVLMPLALAPLVLCGLGWFVGVVSEGALWGKVTMTVIALALGATLLASQRMTRRATEELRRTSESAEP